MKRLFLIALAAAVLVGVGIAHGVATDRWVEATGSDNPGRIFADMPMTFGDWSGEVMPRESDDPMTSVTNCKFTTARGRWMLTSLTSGRPGRVSIHNPEHCYLGSGYKLVDDIRQETIPLGDGKSAVLWTGHFEKKKPTGVESIRIYWGWSNDGNWQSPTYPRISFAGRSRLHKLYLIHPVTSVESAADTAGYSEFMVRYINEVNRRLSP